MMKFRHPHDETVIIDNSEIKVESTRNSGAKLLAAVVTSKGIDGETKTFSDFSKLVKEYGLPDMRRYGQSYYQVLNWLKSGGTAQVLRITADDATYSNLMVLADVETLTEQKKNEHEQPLYATPSGEEVTESSGNTPIMLKKIKITYRGESLVDLKSFEEDIVKEKMKGKDTSSGNKKTIPLFTVLSKGKGEYGDAYRVRITPNLMADRDTAYRNYMFELFLNEGGLSKAADPVNVALFPEAQNNYRRSEFIDDVIKSDIYPIKLFSYDFGFSKVMAEVLPVLKEANPDAGLTEENVDFLFGFTKAGELYEGLEIVNTALPLTAVEGIKLSGGSDGKFAMSNSERQQHITAQYVRAFNGDIDQNFHNKKKFPADIILDANFPVEVKKAILNCRAKRNDCIYLPDGGILNSLQAAKAWRKSDFTVDDWAVAAPYFQHFNTKDEYTGKEIKVTIPYLFSILLPKHFANVGSHRPMAGENYPIRDIIIEGSLKPVIYQPEDKSEFYDLRINYLEEDVNAVIIGTQLTSQTKTSELSNMNNIFVLFEIKRAIETLVPRFRYEFTDTDADMANFNRDVSQVLQPFQDYKCKYVEGVVSQTPGQRDQHILQTKLNIGFKSFAEKNQIILNID